MLTATTETTTKKRAKPGSGLLYQRGGETWWIKYHQHGRAFYESTRTTHYPAARKILRDRLGAIDKGETVMPRLDRVTYDEAAKALRDHYTVTGARDPTEAGYRLAHL